MQTDNKTETASNPLLGTSIGTPSLTQTTVRGQLTDKHFDELVTGSGINQTIAISAFESVGDSKELLNRASGAGSGWKAIAVDPQTGKLDGQLVNFKPDKAQGKAKYLNRTGGKRDSICLQMPDPHYWSKVNADIKQPIFLPEGTKKAASMLSQGYAAIALPSITDYKQKGTDKPHQNTLTFLQAGREVYLVPDADFRTKKSVALSVADHIHCLLSYQVIVKVLVWDKNQGKGIDDLIVGSDSEDVVRELMRTALTVKEFRALLTSLEDEHSFNESDESVEDAVLRILTEQYPNAYFRADAQWLVKKDGYQLKVVKDEEVKVTIASTLRKLVKYTSKGDRKQNLATKTNINNCYEVFKDHCEVNSRFNTRPGLLFFQNGIFDTDTNEFRAYQDSDISLVNLPYSYNPKATCPDDIYSFWAEKYGDHLKFTAEQQVEQLQAIGRFYLDCSENSHWEYFIHLIGKQGSGKGLLCQLIASLYEPENVSHIDNLSYLSEATKAQDYLAGEKRLCLGSEIHSHIEDQSGFYKLAVGESVTTRRLFHQTNDKSRYYTRFLLASTASLTTSAKANEGLGRRMIVLKTNGSQGKPTTQSGGKINFKALAGAYASWALQMPRQKMEAVLKQMQQATSAEATLNYNPLAMFVAECFERVNNSDRRHSDEDFVTQMEMYNYYSAWASFSKAPAFGRNKFYERLRETIDVLYRPKPTGSQFKKGDRKSSNRFIGLRPVLNLINRNTTPIELNPETLIEGQTLDDLLKEVDTREPIQYEEPQINYEVKTSPPNPSPEDLAF